MGMSGPAKPPQPMPASTDGRVALEDADKGTIEEAHRAVEQWAAWRAAHPERRPK